MPYFVASDLHLHCLPITILGSPDLNGLKNCINLVDFLPIFILCHMIVAGNYSIKLVVHLCVGLSLFLFPGNNLSKCQWIFTKICVWIDVKEVWFGIANGQIFVKFDRVICPLIKESSFVTFCSLSCSPSPF